MKVTFHAPFGLHFSSNTPTRIQRRLWPMFGHAVRDRANDNFDPLECA